MLYILFLFFSLPEYFVVPSVCSDGELNRAAPHFEDGRVPVSVLTFTVFLIGYVDDIIM